MSIPNVIYGHYGDEKVTQSTKIGNLPFGQLMILPDGRKFRHSQAGGTALSAGVMVSVSAVVDGHGGYAGSGLKASATSTYNAVSATTIRLLSKLVAFSTDQYADGYLNVQGPGASTYIGHLYKIKSNKSCAAAAELEIELEASDGLKIAFAAVSTTCSLRRSPFRDAIVAASAKALMGATPVNVSASYYFWMQTGGPASLKQSVSTVTDGEMVTCESAVAGSVALGEYGRVESEHIIGEGMEGMDSSAACLVNMTLE